VRALSSSLNRISKEIEIASYANIPPSFFEFDDANHTVIKSLNSTTTDGSNDLIANYDTCLIP
jgi:hypothetical protein